MVCADGPINANMARPWEAFERKKARYWVFLDDDIEFLGGDVLGDCVRAMVRHRWAGCSIYSTFDPDHKERAERFGDAGLFSRSRIQRLRRETRTRLSMG